MMMPFFSYLCIATIFVFGSLLWCSPVKCCVPHDAQMLLAFKHAVLLHNSTASTDPFLPSWKNGTDCCKSWERVVCHPSTSHVQQLHLYSSYYHRYYYDRLHLNSSYYDGYYYDRYLSFASTFLSLNASSTRIALHPLSKLQGLTYLDLSGDTLKPSVVLSSLSKFPAISHIILRDSAIESSGVKSISLDEWSHESLKRMKYLDLGGSRFIGKLPSQLANMSNLFHLDLSNNYFTFTSQVIEMSLPSMMSLQYLDLSEMNLSMTTQHLWHNSVANLSHLTSLFLIHCSLTESLQRMNWLGKLHNLEGLSVASNSIMAMFPLVLNNLTKLTLLDMSHNKFTGEIPYTLGIHLHNLKRLSLKGNDLVGVIPNSLANMSSLEILYLGNNYFITRFPEWISGLENLIDFKMPSARLIGSISPSFTLPPKLQTFVVSSNNMTGTISDTFFSYAKELGDIEMSKSGLTINVSSTWIPPLDAQIVLFASCNIGGNFPEWTSLLQDLSILDLSSNGIVGNLPSWFFDGAMNLLQLYIYDNGLEGALPICGADNGRLYGLDASNNKFTTAQFGECLNLELLNLENNYFQVRLPRHFGKRMTRIKFLSLQNNEFVGALPNSLGECTSLQILNLANNSFVGKFPRWIFNLHDLIVLKMSSNNLAGEIPNEIGIMTKLRLMDLSLNHFKGVIPQGLWNLPTLQHKILDFTNESISFSEIIAYGGNPYASRYRSGIVDFYSKGVHLEYEVILKALAFIDLSHNNLSGRLPINVGKKFKGLKQLNLSHNRISGPIPGSISEMDELESLDLSHNHFFGKIPQRFGGLSALGFLDLSYNNLSGIIPRAGQMLTFDSSRFKGNMNLIDPQNNNRKEGSEEHGICCENDGDSMKKYNVEEMLWGLSVGLSFGIGFALFTLTMLFNKVIKTKTLKLFDHVIRVWIFKY